MGANIAGIYGAQIFREDDRPRYRRGFGVNIAVLAVGLSLAVSRFLDDRILRRKKARAIRDESGSEYNAHDDGTLRKAPPSDVQPQPLAVEGRRASVANAGV